MTPDPNSYHRPDKPPVIPRHLTSSDLQDLYRVMTRVLQDQGLTPHPPIDCEGQRKLGLKTLLQEARRAGLILARGIRSDQTGDAKQAQRLLEVVAAIEKEWNL